VKKPIPTNDSARVYSLIAVINILLAVGIIYNVLDIAGLVPAYHWSDGMFLRSLPVTAETQQNSDYADVEKTSRWSVVQMRVTAYCPCSKCCGIFADGLTATGHKIAPGDHFVAADKNLPFGTEVIVPGYNQNKPVKVLDRGRVINGNRLDVFFPKHNQAVKWGVKYLDVMVKRPNSS